MLCPYDGDNARRDEPAVAHESTENANMAKDILYGDQAKQIEELTKRNGLGLAADDAAELDACAGGGADGSVGVLSHAQGTNRIAERRRRPKDGLKFRFMLALGNATNLNDS